MERVYKMDKPSNTVNRVREIFNKTGLMTYEEYWKDVEGKIFSCGVTLEGTKYLRKLGKGMSRSYCLASGYGELIERIENLILFTGRVGMSFDKVLDAFPDTKEVCDFNQLMALNSEKCKEGIEAVCKDIKLDKDKPFPNRVLSGEFYDVMNDEVVYLPYSEILRGVRSNGMCAGNTFDEAVIEGICEVVERMAIKEIFYENMVPPTIPRSYLKQYPAFQVIEELEARGIAIDVKDCSMCKGFPVLGILVINKNTGEYKYNFGAHPVFNRALERCLGEICQVAGGVKNVQEFLNNGLALDLVNDPYKANGNRGREFFRQSNLYKALKNSNGKLPIGFFMKDPTYKFTEWRNFENSISYQEDLKIFIRLLKKDNKYVYIRDVSFLHFPAYYVYITEYSPVQVDYSFEDWKKYMSTRKSKSNLVMLFSKISSCNNEEILDLINYLKLSINNPKYYNQEVDNNWIEELLGTPVKKENIISPEYVISMLYLKRGDCQSAYTEFMNFINKNYHNPEENRRYSIIKDYLNLKKISFSEDEVVDALKKYYDENLVMCTLEQLSNNKKILKDFKILDFIDNENYKTVCNVFNSVKNQIQESKINQLDMRASLI